jgi:hypothetical protein
MQCFASDHPSWDIVTKFGVTVKDVSPIQIFVFSLSLCFLLPRVADGQALDTTRPQPLSQLELKLREVRFDLRLDNRKLSGNAVPLLKEAIGEAQYVLIGEDHITSEIPLFTENICDLMAPQGFIGMAVEASREAAEFVSSTIAKQDRIERMATLLKQYPDSVFFLNIRQENDLTAYCSAAAQGPDFHIWGLDQEFLGSAGWLLDQILATHPGEAAVEGLAGLKSEEQQAAARAKESGDPSQLFLFSVSGSELQNVAAQLRQSGNPRANRLFRELTESHEIYLKNMRDSAESNNQRARILKQNLREYLESTSGDEQRKKVLAKFGKWHLYKGLNPLYQRDLGNYIAEMADGQGSHSLHICILGAAGTHRLYAGYARPTKLEKFVMDEAEGYRWLKPAITHSRRNRTDSARPLGWRRSIHHRHDGRRRRGEPHVDHTRVHLVRYG